MKQLLLCMVFLLISCSTQDKKIYMKGYVYGYRDACMEKAKGREQSDKCEDKFNLMRSTYNIK